MSKYICPALGGINDNEKDLCKPKRTPEEICCWSCDLGTPNRVADVPACAEECMKVANGQPSCGDLVD